MSTIELYVTGDEIGFFSSSSISGKSNGTKVTLNGVQTLGSPTDVFRLVVENVGANETGFGGTQVITVYAYPGTIPPTPLYSSFAADANAYNGRATSAEHMIFDGPGSTGLIIDLDGVTNGSMQIGPGINPPRYQEFSFSSLSSTPPTFPCFVRGTLIETGTGPQAIETLRVGDLVRTADHGLQPIRWIASRQVAGHGDMAPVTIAAGALGNYRRLRVSPQHRMLLCHWRNEILFGQSEVLVAAKHLINGTTITQAPQAQVTYVHMVFDQHEIVFAEGIPSESLHLGAMALSSLDRRSRDEVAALFPELADAVNGPPTARGCLRSWEAALTGQPSMTGVLSPAA